MAAGESHKWLKNEDAAVPSRLHTYHNHVRPHLGPPGHSAPGGMAGIHTEGDNKWLTLILAAKAKA